MPLHTGEMMMSLHTGGDICLYIQVEMRHMSLHTGGDDAFTYRRR